MVLVELLSLDQSLADAQLAHDVGHAHHDQGSADNPERRRPQQAREHHQRHDLDHALRGAGREHPQEAMDRVPRQLRVGFGRTGAALVLFRPGRLA